MRSWLHLLSQAAGIDSLIEDAKSSTRRSEGPLHECFVDSFDDADKKLFVWCLLEITPTAFSC